MSRAGFYHGPAASRRSPPISLCGDLFSNPGVGHISFTFTSYGVNFMKPIPGINAESTDPGDELFIITQAQLEALVFLRQRIKSFQNKEVEIAKHIMQGGLLQPGQLEPVLAIKTAKTFTLQNLTALLGDRLAAKLFAELEPIPYPYLEIKRENS